MLRNVWRNVQEAGRNVRKKQSARPRGHAVPTGADETSVRAKGEKAVAGVSADAATGEVLGLDVLIKRESDGFKDWLRDFARDFGVEAMAADDLWQARIAYSKSLSFLASLSSLLA